MAKKGIRPRPPRPLRLANASDPAHGTSDSYTPAKLPDTLPDAQRQHALWQAEQLKAKLEAAIEALTWFRKEHDYACARIGAAARAWELGRDSDKAEREEFFLRIAGAAREPGTAEARAESLLSTPPVAMRLGRVDAQTQQRAREIAVQLLKSWGTPARHRAGEGQWSRAAALVRLIWRDGVSADTLRVEHSRAQANRRRRGGHPAADTLELIKKSPRVLRPPGR